MGFIKILKRKISKKNPVILLSLFSFCCFYARLILQNYKPAAWFSKMGERESPFNFFSDETVINLL